MVSRFDHARSCVRPLLPTFEGGRTPNGGVPSSPSPADRRVPTEGLIVSIAPPPERLGAILARHDIVMATLNAGPDPETFVALSRELSELDPVVAAVRAYQGALENLEGLEALIRDPKTDAEMRALAEEERPQAQEDVERQAKALRLLLLPRRYRSLHSQQ